MADLGTWVDAGGARYKILEAKVIDGVMHLRLEPVVPKTITLEIMPMGGERGCRG